MAAAAGAAGKTLPSTFFIFLRECEFRISYLRIELFLVLLVHNLFMQKLKVLKIHMISNKQKTVATTVAIAAVVLVFAATPIIIAYVQSHEAQAFGRFGGFRGGFGRGGFGFGRGFGGFGGFGAASAAGAAASAAGAAAAAVAAVAAGKHSPPLFLFFKTRKRKSEFCFE